MKKFSSKFIASAILASALAASMAVSASAAVDYWEIPAYTPPSGGSSSGGSTGGSSTPSDEKDINESTGKDALDEDIIAAAIATGADIDVVATDGNCTILESAIGAIAAGDVAITFDVVDDESDVDYSVTIDPALITSVQAINIAMNIRVTEEAVIITPAQHGDFGMTLVVTIPAIAFEGMDLDSAELYYVDDAGNISLVPGGLTVNADGSVSVALSHASFYVISDVDISTFDIGGEVDDDDDDTDITIGDDDTPGKDDTTVVSPSNGSDGNPITGTSLALGSLAVFAAAAVATSKKRK